MHLISLSDGIIDDIRITRSWYKPATALHYMYLPCCHSNNISTVLIITCPLSTATWPCVITYTGTPWQHIPSKMLKSTACLVIGVTGIHGNACGFTWWCVLAEITLVASSSHTTISASEPSAITPCQCIAITMDTIHGSIPCEGTYWIS